MAAKGKLGSALVAAGSVDDSDTDDFRYHYRFIVIVSSTLTEVSSTLTGLAC